MLAIETFKTIVEHAPLISIDFIVRNAEGKILLGKRVNQPVKNYLFTMGGRVYKGEKLEEAKTRILKDELKLNYKDVKSEFIGIFEHFYTNSFVDQSMSTHYVNLVYQIKVFSMKELPIGQHYLYVWKSQDELLNLDEVHDYVKDYFKS